MLEERLLKEIDRFLETTFSLKRSNPDEVARAFVVTAHVAGELLWMKVFHRSLGKHLERL